MFLQKNTFSLKSFSRLASPQEHPVPMYKARMYLERIRKDIDMAWVVVSILSWILTTFSAWPAHRRGAAAAPTASVSIEDGDRKATLCGFHPHPSAYGVYKMGGSYIHGRIIYVYALVGSLYAPYSGTATWSISKCDASKLHHSRPNRAAHAWCHGGAHGRLTSIRREGCLRAPLHRHPAHKHPVLLWLWPCLTVE